MDKLTPQRRSENMRRIKSKNSTPELALRTLIFKMGFRYRLHASQLPGKPDLVFPGRKKAIFLHGCFWHQHGPCPDSRLPKSRQDYWLPKLKRNQERDKDAQRKLRELGWNSLVIWECEMKDPTKIKKTVQKFLKEKGPETECATRRSRNTCVLGR